MIVAKPVQAHIKTQYKEVLYLLFLHKHLSQKIKINWIGFSNNKMIKFWKRHCFKSRIQKLFLFYLDKYLININQMNSSKMPDQLLVG